MTGYGKSEVICNGFSFTIEIKALNSRFFEFVPRLPGFLSFMEDEAHRRVKRRCQRGRITLSIQQDFYDNSGKIPELDIEQVKQYRKIVIELGQILNREQDVPLESYLNLPNVIKTHQPVDEEELVQRFFKGLEEALDNLYEMRMQEGEFLAKDILGRLSTIQEYLDAIRKADRDQQEESILKYRERVQRLADNIPLDENRLYQEIAIQAEKRDITEELVRMSSHIKLFISYFDSDESEGKKMNFLLQEMGREMNTVGSKADTHMVSHLVVDTKNELEKIREQVQNIL